mmetsp:Transcript_3721/g.4881  ORF Transcript_3721/g.4881 Transcript_3721/m.4881 type:complete len:351 (+) Transcript_3721:78-1130(+)
MKAIRNDALLLGKNRKQSLHPAIKISYIIFERGHHHWNYNKWHSSSCRDNLFSSGSCFQTLHTFLSHKGPRDTNNEKNRDVRGSSSLTCAREVVVDRTNSHTAKSFRSNGTLKHTMLQHTNNALLVNIIEQKNRSYRNIVRNNSTFDNSNNSGDKSNSIQHNNETNNSKNESTDRKEKMQKAAIKGQKVVKKGAHSVHDLVKKYGRTFVGTYFTIYIVTLGSLFVGLDTGIIDPATLSHIDLPWHSGHGADEQNAADAEEFKSSVELVAAYMAKYEWTAPYADMVQKNTHTSNLAIAWVATKLTEPIRLPLTLTILPRISKMMGKKSDDTDKEAMLQRSDNIAEVSKVKK